MSETSDLNVLLGCLICLVPFVGGWIFGAWFSHRAAQHGIIGALLPDFIRRIFERYQ